MAGALATSERIRDVADEFGMTLDETPGLVCRCWGTAGQSPPMVPHVQVDVPRTSSSKRASPQSPPRTASSSKRPRLGLEPSAKIGDDDEDGGESSDDEEGEDEEGELVAPFKRRDLSWLTVDDGDPIAKKHFPPAFDQVRGFCNFVVCGC